MKIKGHFHNSSELPKKETNPSRKIPSASFRFIQEDKGRRDAAALCASLSFLSNGLEMYYYANVNFDTEFKKRLLGFFLFSKKKKVPYVVIIASLFCNVNCNYAFCKRGEEGQEGEGSSFASYSMVSVSMVSHVLAGKGSESKKR